MSVTHWTEQAELFAEYPQLAVGETSRFAIHLTTLEPFKAVTAGRVTVSLSGGATPPEMFEADAPSRPGIFGIDVKPARAGHRQLTIRLSAGGLQDEHQLGEVEVFPNLDAAMKAPAPEESAVPGISFLKEQQWTLDFGTGLVREGSLSASLAVPARVEPRPDGAADVTAPIDGRLTDVAAIPVGGSVARDQELGRILPPPGAPADLPALERAQAEAQALLAQASRDRERAERLVAAGAAPARRLEEARSSETQAQARLTAAEASLAQFNRSRSGRGAEVVNLFSVRAPLSGVVAARNATSGANVTSGSVLFRIVDAAQVQVVGQVPEGDAWRVRASTGGELELAGRSERIPTGRLISVGKVLDASSRTLPITFAFDNMRVALPVGQAATLHVLLPSAGARPVAPVGAVVDDAGRPIVFVQREGETFERRAVTLGGRSGDLVEIVEGVKPGERVVTKGAYLVRLASLSTSVPAHGHVH